MGVEDLQNDGAWQSSVIYGSILDDCSPSREFTMTTPENVASNTIANAGLPPGKMPQLRVMPAPSDANVYGDVFGGWIMAQVDVAGSLPAASAAFRRKRRRCWSIRPPGP
jgi:hypothetical protein